MTLTEFLLARTADAEKFAREALAFDMPQRRGMTERLALVEYVLRDCEAKRRIVELHWPGYVEEPDPLGGCAECGEIPRPEGNWCLTLKYLALPYADHPEFREEWRLD